MSIHLVLSDEHRWTFDGAIDDGARGDSLQMRIPFPGQIKNDNAFSHGPVWDTPQAFQHLEARPWSYVKVRVWNAGAKFVEDSNTHYKFGIQKTLAPNGVEWRPMGQSVRNVPPEWDLDHLLTLLDREQQDYLSLLDASTISAEQLTKYFGSEGRDEFYEIFREVSMKNALLYTTQTSPPNSTLETLRSQIVNGRTAADIAMQRKGEDKAHNATQPDRLSAKKGDDYFSPRHHFLTEVVNKHLPPRANYVIRKAVFPDVNLQHQGMGDELCEIFSRCLIHLPGITGLNLRDNRLTDPGLSSIVSSIRFKPNLYNLDLSDNKLDGNASEMLATYLAAPTCSLKKLVLSKADLDDGEVVSFMEALQTNQTVEYLDLSCNLIGDSESLNVVQPDLITGGEAIADMLCNNSTLRYLDISWNTIRLNSAVEIGNSLKINNTLEELNVAFNAFADAGTAAVASGLSVNTSLNCLDLSNNNVPITGAFVLAGALKTNSTLSRLKLQGNPLGAVGGKALMKLVSSRKVNKLNLELLNCNFDVRSQSGVQIFDPDHPSGAYELDLAVPYERAIAAELMRIAVEVEGYKFLHLQHQEGSLDRESNGRTMFQKYADWQAVQSIGQGSSESTQVYKVRRVEKDGVRALDTKVPLLVDSEGPSNPKSLANQGATGRTGPRFSTVLNAQSMDTTKAVKHVFRQLDKDKSGAIDEDELLEGFRMMGLEHTSEFVGKMIRQYDLDGSGLVEEREFIDMMCHLMLDRMPRKIFYLEDQKTGLPFVLPDNGILKAVFNYTPVTQIACLDDEGLNDLIENLTSLPDKVRLYSVCKNQFHLKSKQASRILKEVLEEMNKVHAIGMLLPHLLNTRHCRDFVIHELDAEERMRLQAVVGYLYLPSIGLTTGHYKLDLALLLERQALRKLIETNNEEIKRRKHCYPDCEDLSQKGNWQNFRNVKLNGKEYSIPIERFEELPTAGVVEFDYVSTATFSPDVQCVSTNRFNQFLKRLGLTDGAGDSSTGREGKAFEVIQAQDYKSIKLHKYEPRMTPAIYDLVGQMRAEDFEFCVPSDMFKAIQLSREGTPTQVTGKKLLSDLQDFLVTWNLSVAQAYELLTLWPAQLENARIEALVCMFSKLVDVENFHKISHILTDREMASCIHRLGWLSIMNPLCAREYYELDMGQRDEREVAKMLVRLADDEPGENWQGATFGWTKEEAVPGWVLNVGWYTDAGVPRKGYLRVLYYDGADQDCAPVWKTRKELREKLTLCGTRIEPVPGKTRPALAPLYRDDDS